VQTENTTLKKEQAKVMEENKQVNTTGTSESTNPILPGTRRQKIPL